jgi:tRNA pseudouridine38-40 synthase
MTRVKLTLEYDGTSFNGWQIQPDRPTIQGAVESALTTVLREDVRVHAAGRTDAGVHARGQVAAFDAREIPPLHSLCPSINALAGPDIAALEAEVVPESFCPRRSARSRYYAYRIVNRRAASPLWKRQAWHIVHELDVEAMNAAAALLVGEHDFSSFRDADCDARHPVRRVMRSEIVRDGDLLVYSVEATAFLRHMVRTIMGSLVVVGSGRLSVDGFRELLLAHDRTRAGRTAPARGLCLEAVRY